ncbi:MAG: hypothetical protein HUJ86_07275 [Synergistes sp.]|nr:hypothetical protein [Synergistes sp.]
MKNRKLAFTLVECLVALALICSVVPFFYVPFKNALYLYRLYSDRRIAEERIETVEAILSGSAFYCGHGMPSDGSEYKKVFLTQTSRAPFSWDGPVSVVTDNGDTPDGRLRIAYAFPYPGGYRVFDDLKVENTAKEFKFSPMPDADYFDTGIRDPKQSTKNWIIFENSEPLSQPVLVSKINMESKTLSLRSYSDEVYVPKGDKMLLYSAMMIYSRSGLLLTNDYRTAGNQPRENGVGDIRFELNTKKNMLTVYIAVYGDDETLSPGTVVNPELCPADMIAPLRTKSKQILYCAKFVRPLMNNNGN